MPQPLILTLKIDDESFHYFDSLRQQYFPLKRNFLAAHITLFHHLPGEKLENIKGELAKVCAETQKFSVHFTEWRFLGKGTAMKIESDELLKVRSKLGVLWRDYLTAQDKQKFQPHITVQNKVEPNTARELFETLSAGLKLKTGEAEGLTLWHYMGGPWKLEEEFPFLG